VKSEEMAMKIVVLYAIQESQRGLVWYWENRSKINAMPWTTAGVKEWEAMTGVSYEETMGPRVRTWENVESMGKSYAHAWLLALNDLGEEIGVDLMPFARAFAEEHMDAIGGISADMEVDYSTELDNLRWMWKEARQ